MSWALPLRRYAISIHWAMCDLQVIHKLTLYIPDTYTQELVIAHLDQAGVTAMEQGHDHIIVYSSDVEELRNLCHELSKYSLVGEDGCVIDAHQAKNWNEVWESTFKPVEIGQFCRIRASFHEKKPDVRYDLIIDPEMAFGTGHHETTFLMIAEMEFLYVNDKTVLDYGCGTGILAILASKLGSSKVLAIDHDPKAVASAQRNVELNHSRGVDVRRAGIEEIPLDKWDIVLANINRNVLKERSRYIVERLSPGGIALLSGILNEDVGQIQETYERLGLYLAHSRVKNEWSILKMAKR